MALVEQIGTEIPVIPGIPTLVIRLDRGGDLDLTLFDSRMKSVTRGLYLMGKPPGPAISQIKFAVCENGSLDLIGFPERKLFETFVDAYNEIVEVKIRSIGHIRVVSDEQQGILERRIMGASTAVLQRMGFVSPRDSERFRTGRLRQELGSYFDFDDGVVKRSPRFGLQILRRLPWF